MRNSQAQQRLNHCALLLAHRGVTREMELDGIIDEFVARTFQRMNMFWPTNYASKVAMILVLHIVSF